MGLTLPNASDEPNPKGGRPSRIAVEFDDADRAEILNAYVEDFRSAEWIARRVGVSANAVRNWLIDQKVWRWRG
jgi:transposase-like protein